ncbi:MAG: DUF885 domain-containing protein [Acidobacteria bacterium]|nr:DUF885 domain-containing protein [Acidobacteriota bacterium]
MRLNGILVAVVLAASTVGAQPPAPDWVETSNGHAQVLLGVMAETSPETAARYGVEGVDEEILDLSAGYRERRREALRAALRELETRLENAEHPKVRQDLEIMIGEVELDLAGQELSDELELPYYDLNRLVFHSLHGLLDERVAAERRPAAFERLKRYAGLAAGYEPIALLATQRTREKLDQAGLQAPYRGELEKSLADGPQMRAGLAPLFEEFGIDGYEGALEVLEDQLAVYDDFVRKELLPRAREDFRQRPEIYAHSLRQLGIDVAPEELAWQARASFREIQLQMQEVAAHVAELRTMPSSDYRDVIRQLKAEQLVGDAILPHYQQRLRQIEEIVRREDLVTLPARAARIRLATEAESAAIPAPHMSMPRLVGNSGELGEFVLPLRIPGGEGTQKQFDDFTFAAASWTLTVHEARPGHEMQFASMIEGGVSMARAIFAANSTNVEGWALYAESFVKPWMPPEGQLVSLQHRLVRAARAFLDPELQLGKISPEEARRLLREDVVLSDAAATSEIDRYTFRMPGQACSYYYGYSRMITLRSDVQKALGASFDPRAFHDFVLAQGLLTPGLLRQAVFEDFVPAATR